MLFQSRQKQKQLNRASFRAQQGVVIVIALFVMAIIATMAYMMMARLQRDTERTTLILRNTEANYLAEGSLAWAKDQLRQTKVAQMPMQSPVNHVKGFQIESKMEDLQGHYNINNLAGKNDPAVLLRLIMILKPDLGKEKTEALAKGILDWVAPKSSQTEFDKYYLSLPTPYRSSHQNMRHISELRLVKGMTSELYQLLIPYLIALPESTPVNVNAVTAPVLMALSPILTLAEASQLVSMRQVSTFKEAKDFMALDIVKKSRIEAGAVTTESVYFLVRTKVSIENQNVVLYTLLERKVSNGKPVVNTIWQSKGVR